MHADPFLYGRPGIFTDLNECLDQTQNCNNVGLCQSYDQPHHDLLKETNKTWQCVCPSQNTGVACQYEDWSVEFWLIFVSFSLFGILFVTALAFLLSCSLPQHQKSSHSHRSIIDGQRYNIVDGSRIKDD
jgi:Domain of unknown function (DUF3844)